MKVLQLGKFYPVGGGVEKVMVDLMGGLSARGMYCDMLCAGVGLSGISRINSRSKLICVDTWCKLAATMIAPGMISQLRRICQEYDIIHVHHPDPMACLALYLSGYKGRVVLHWHSDIAKQRFLLQLYRPLQHWLLKRADVVVGTSPVYMQESPHLAHWQHKVFCLPIGIEPVSPDKEAVEEIRSRYGGRHIIFSLGRLVPYKGYRYLIEAARYLGEDYVVLIGGTGPLRDELQELIRHWGVTDRVKLLGRISEEDLPAYYGACSLFCLSSVQKTEAFGIVQIEAMSCGKPVVATRIPQSGVAWVNSDEESGLNVEPGDARALASALRRICEDEELGRRLSAGARERFQRLFHIDRMIDETINLYNQLWKNQ